MTEKRLWLYVLFGTLFGFLTSMMFLLLYYGQSFQYDISDALRFRSAIYGTLFIVVVVILFMNRDWIIKEFRRGLAEQEEREKEVEEKGEREKGEGEEEKGDHWRLRREGRWSRGLLGSILLTLCSPRFRGQSMLKR